MGETLAEAILGQVRVLITGMSGAGKSALVHELQRQGLRAFDADEDGFSEPRADGRWGWRAERVAALLGGPGDGHLFFAGCSEEQATLPFDFRVLLTAPVDVLLERLRARTGNRYGQRPAEEAQVLADLAEVEPLLRRSADLILETTTEPPERLADVLLNRLGRATWRRASDRRPAPRTRR
jgi:shikimate kinase